MLDDQLSGTFQQDFDSLTPNEAGVLLLINAQNLPVEEIAPAFPDISEHSRHRILHNLSRLGFLRRINGVYQAGNVLLGQWLATGPVHRPPRGGITNQMTRQVAQEQLTALQRQLIARIRHLGQLELRQAKQGLETPAHIITEIEDYKKRIADIETELAELGENITPHQSFPAE